MVKMSSTSSESSASLPAAPTTGMVPVALASGRRSRWVTCLGLVNSGTYSKMMFEFSRPYQRAGEPHHLRMTYLAFIVRQSRLPRLVEGESTLRSMQKRKSPTWLGFL